MGQLKFPRGHGMPAMRPQPKYNHEGAMARRKTRRRKRMDWPRSRRTVADGEYSREMEQLRSLRAQRKTNRQALMQRRGEQNEVEIQQSFPGPYFPSSVILPNKDRKARRKEIATRVDQPSLFFASGFAPLGGFAVVFGLLDAIGSFTNILKGNHFALRASEGYG
jgi:hypothetical protein